MVDVWLAVRPGAGDPELVVDAVRRHAPHARLAAVWGGDPHRRPLAPTGARWADLGLEEPHGLGWERLLVASGGARTALAKAWRALATVGVRGPTVVLSVGDVVVDGDVTSLVPTHGLAIARRQPLPPIDDGRAPTAADIARLGSVGVGAVAISGGDEGAALAATLADALTLAAPDATPGAAIAPAVGGASVLPGAAFVGDPPSPAPVVIDTSVLDRSEPWHVYGDLPARHPLSADGPLASAEAREHDQWAGADECPCLPGGLAVDDAIVALVRTAVGRWRREGATLPPEPWSDATAFRRWLEAPANRWGPDLGRYWVQWHTLRPDLRVVFPAPEGRDFRQFRAWAEARWWADGESSLLRTGAGTMRPPWLDVGRAPGVNLVGYLGYDKSIGDVARRVGASLDAASVPHAALDYHRSGSPRTLDPPPTTDELRYDTNLCIINADQIPNLVADHGAAMLPGRRTIGYWFWELEQVPESFRGAIETVDEIWAGSDFVADAFRAVTDRPVRTVPIPLPEPHVPPITRADLGLPDDRFVFLVTFDYLSVAERKNPIGVIEAFRRAVPAVSDDGPLLVVKSLNAHLRPHQAERTALAAAGRDDIWLVDRHATRDEQLALTGVADALVSLHRSEGLGLHLMEAMWLGTPTIATRYSGNMSFCTDENCALVDAGRTLVVGGDGYLPPGAVWADPDLDQAADAMRRMLTDAAWRGSLVEAGRTTMASQPSLAAVGRRIAEICDTARVGATT